jgi:o-succinylbenzoate synthase
VGYTMPGDVSASKRYWHEDVIEPAIEVSSDGTITAPDGPGLGFEIKQDRIGKAAVRRSTIG